MGEFEVTPKTPAPETYYCETPFGACLVPAMTRKGAVAYCQTHHNVHAPKVARQATWGDVFNVVQGGGWAPFDLRDFIDEMGWVKSSGGVRGGASFYPPTPEEKAAILAKKRAVEDERAEYERLRSKFGGSR